MPKPQADTTAKGDSPATAVSDVQACLDSALFWVEALPRYANKMQEIADRWAIASSVLGLVSGLAIWATLAQSTTFWAQAIVTGVAFATGVCGVIPRIRNYGEMAGSARGLIPRYARSSGELRSLWEHREWLDKPQAQTIVETFQAMKEAKDQLRYLPTRPNTPPRRSDAGFAEWDDSDLNGLKKA